MTKHQTKPVADDERIPLVVAASDNETMSKFANPGLTSTFDVFPLISKWSLDFQAGNKQGLQSVGGVASRSLQELASLAFSGRAEAAKEFYKILLSNVLVFDELCHTAPQLFEPIARRQTVWPALLSCDADVTKR